MEVLTQLEVIQPKVAAKASAQRLAEKIQDVQNSHILSSAAGS